VGVVAADYDVRNDAAEQAEEQRRDIPRARARGRPGHLGCAPPGRHRGGCLDALHGARAGGEG